MLTVTTNKTTYTAGETVVVTLTLVNDTNQTQTYDFSSSQRYDIVVSRNGREVYRWSEGRMFLQVLSSETLAPGEQRIYTETLTLQAAPGTYTVTGMITSTNLPEQDSTTITIS